MRTESVSLEKLVVWVACSVLVASLGAAVTGCAQEARASVSTAESTPEPRAVESAAVAVVQPAATSGKLGLTLDGSFAGFPVSAAGGDAFADVVSETNGKQQFPKKHLGTVKYDKLQTQIGLGMSKDVYAWISNSWNASGVRKNGAVLTASFDNHVVASREFFDALITETTFPTLDSSSKDPAFLTLTFAPGSTRDVKGTGESLPPDNGGSAKRLIASNFRLDIAGLPTARVSKIDSFAVKQSASGTTVSNLKVTLAESDAQAWTDWFQDFVVKGNSSDKDEKQGLITFLDPSLKGVLGTVELHNIGIRRLAAANGSDGVARVTAELYVEEVVLNVPGL